ncbi:hypothetical protein ACIRST_26120 [Kitasatospora sp. NPDC101447]|uniref:hypothetical protein n=1 Tax=Kitasatospora sp. NPDC101447 TaxID=3364102 RepID=UPI0037F770AF
MCHHPHDEEGGPTAHEEENEGAERGPPPAADRRTRLDLAAHRSVHPLPPHPSRDDLLALAEGVDLRGRGGAGFRFARKARATLAASDRSGARPVIVVNGAEGEPPSAKDAMLLARVPHLVLDGACAAAAAFGAEEIVIGVAAGGPGEDSVTAALAERENDLPRGHEVPSTRLLVRAFLPRVPG